MASLQSQNFPGAIYIPATPPSAHQQGGEGNENTVMPSTAMTTVTGASGPVMPPPLPSSALKGSVIKSGLFEGFYDQPPALSAFQWNDLDSRGRCYWKREWVHGEWQERAVKFGELDNDQKVSWFNAVYHSQMMQRMADGGLYREAGSIRRESSIEQSQGSGDAAMAGDEEGDLYPLHIERGASPAAGYGPMPLHIAPETIDGGLSRAKQDMAKDDQMLAFRLCTPMIEAHKHLRNGTDRRSLSQKMHDSFTASGRKITKNRIYRRSAKFPGQIVEVCAMRPNGGHEYSGLNTHIGARWRSESGAAPPIYKEGWGEFTSAAARAKRQPKPVGEAETKAKTASPWMEGELFSDGG